MKGNGVNISSFLIDMVSAVIAIEYMDRGFEKKYSGARRWFLFAADCIIYSTTVTVMNCMIRFEGILAFSYGVIVLGYGIVALEGRFRELLNAALLWVVIVATGSLGAYGLIGVITGKTLAELRLMEGGLLIYTAATVSTVKFSMGRIANALFRTKDSPRRAEDRIIAGAFLLMSLLVLGMFRLEYGDLEQESRFRLTIGLLMAQFGVTLLLIHIYGKLGRYERAKLEEKHLKEREEKRWEEFMNLYRIGKEINHWRHDMIGGLDVMYRLQKKGKYQEVADYLEKLDKMLKEYPELPQETGNEGLDAALIRIIPMCREKGIRFRYVILGKVEQVDCVALGILMDNLLVNGVEACMKLGGRKELELIVRNDENRIEILLENSIESSVLEENPLLQSRKRDSAKHGFGMESIYGIIGKYHGEYVCWEEDGNFCQSIVLLKQQEMTA